MCPLQPSRGAPKKVLRVYIYTNKRNETHALNNQGTNNQTSGQDQEDKDLGKMGKGDLAARVANFTYVCMHVL